MRIWFDITVERVETAISNPTFKFPTLGLKIAVLTPSTGTENRISKINDVYMIENNNESLFGIIIMELLTKCAKWGTNNKIMRLCKVRKINTMISI